MSEDKTVFDGQAVMHLENETDRRNFFKWAGIVGVGSTLAVGGLGKFATAQSNNSDLEILNYALTLEFLEAEFYTRGLDEGVVSGRQEELITPIRDHEQAHVDAITQTINDLGGTPVDKPKFKFPSGTFNNKKKFLETAKTFEELGVDAYHGQVTKIKSKDILAAAAAIAGVESRHAAVLEDLVNGEPFPAPVEDSKTMQQVLDAAKPFIQS